MLRPLPGQENALTAALTREAKSDKLDSPPPLAGAAGTASPSAAAALLSSDLSPPCFLADAGIATDARGAMSGAALALEVTVFTAAAGEGAAFRLEGGGRRVLTEEASEDDSD